MNKPRVRDALIVFVLLSVASLSPIWSNDYFWHLAAGRWIVEHGTLPQGDPLAVASSREPWINGEWLFQVLVFGVDRAGGDNLVAAVRAMAVAAVFALLFLRLSRETEWFTAACITLFAWYGAVTWLRERPSTLGAFLLLALLFLLERKITARTLAGIFLLVVIWANIHPSALLAPVIATIVAVGVLIAERSISRATSFRLLGAAALAGLALLVNPHGIRGALNPFHVAQVAQLPIFRNEEWGATSFREYPLFAIALVACAAIVATSARRAGWIPSALVLAFLAVLAVRFVRNQSLFYVVGPLLLAPHIRPVPPRIRRLLLVPVALTLVAILANSNFGAGVDQAKFPVTAARAVQELRLPGNVLSDYGMGGYLIWSFAPERRVLTDGRNELYVDYQTAWLEARKSSKGWEQFLAHHKVGVAFVPRRAPKIWTRDAGTGERRPLPEWDVYLPEKDWALVALDDSAAAFASRATMPAGQEQVEIPRAELETWSR